MTRIARHSALLLVAFASLHAAAQQLGTLFNTPEERARLDRLRRGEPVLAAGPAAHTHAARKPAITGYVQRSDGRNTVWIDGHPVLVAAPRARATLEPGMVQDAPRDAPRKAEEPD